MAEQLPIWQAPGVEPPTSLKTDGWQPGMKPSAQHMNWLFNRAYKCLEEIQAGGGTEELEQELANLQQALATHLAEDASLTAKGHVQLDNSTSSTSETKAATPKAVNDGRIAAIDFAKSFGLGHIAKNLTTNTDLDSLQEVGFYYANTSITNKPSNSNGWLISMPLSSTYSSQLFISLDTNTTHTRVKINGAWSAWKQLETTANKNVANGYAGLDGNGKILASNVFKLIAGSTQLTPSVSASQTNLTLNVWQEVVRWRIFLSGSVRVSWKNGGNVGADYYKAQVYKNGQPYGSEISQFAGGNQVSVDVPVSDNDTISIYLKITGSSAMHSLSNAFLARGDILYDEFIREL